MKAFYHEDQSQHDPKFYMKNGNPTPARETPERGDIFRNVIHDLEITLDPSSDFGMSHIAEIHSPDYLNFLQSVYPKWAALPDASKEIIPKSNPGRYASTYPKDIIGQVGWHIMDTSCPLGEGTWSGVYASAQTAISAADAVAKEECKSAYAVCRPPGHHAFSDGGAGFCFLNNSGIAAQRLLKDFDRVAILDVDLHHGNGTQAIFWNRRDVMTISIHADPAYCYPHFWGYAHEKGEGDGYGYNLNFPIDEGTSDTEYMKVLEQALDQLKAFAPDAIILALGLDASEEDPFAVLNLTTEGFGEIGKRVEALNKPTVIIQEGGYISPILGDNLAAVLKPFASS
ncbi:histone deacetylase family protein [Cocleimonas sp. KMM 6892]|uniref:histone deacetylase family protein n=1 Tax=unclassified Cocleimonas TaxID=2639732 RepID=UPI002DB8E0A8|nr:MULTISPECIES: histone deacetylase family protein [unclassified Cocleimonas]MEB8433259.1 histone deacetylase family protein [Cocleimonas sp. KMM 6892]MEC4715760.1 histone deacetylase family protein [Cocleimonas sp. KMM 6895]MEC4745221.1 histone deacetylase family protein [Cocleimonas sp. KMM 6896]